MKKKLIIKIFVIFLLIPFTNVFAYYWDTNFQSVKGEIAEPIVVLNTISQKQECEINKNFNSEYRFKLCNYHSLNNNIRISEVSFKCKIKIEITNENFPVKFELYNLAGENLLENNNISKEIIIEKNKLYDEDYILKVYWEKGTEELATNTDINIKICALQCL